MKLAELLANVELGRGGCYLWKGAVSTDGYAVVRMSGVTHYAHRLAFTDYYGPLAVDEDLTPTVCGARKCINPLHWRRVKGFRKLSSPQK